MARSLIGTRIRERRRARSISQTRLAKEVGISASYLSLIEHNRRAIAGKTLLSLARVLETSPGYLSDGAEQGLIDRIQKAAENFKSVEPEMERIEEFIGRFPGLAKLIGRLHDELKLQNQNLQVLSDKLANDPALAETIHLMLSSITIIRSTADILLSSSDIPEERRGKFISNLLAESERLSVTSAEVLRHFEPLDKEPDYERDDQRLEHYMRASGHFIERLESGNYQNHLPEVQAPEDQAPEPHSLVEVNSQADTSAAVTSLLDDMKIPVHDRRRAGAILKTYRQMAERLPGDKFMPEAKRLRYDPIALAASFNAELPLVFWRLAHMPPGEHQPEFGMLECDASSAVLYRKQLPSFKLPRNSGACPLWPVYRCFSQPMQPVSAVMTIPNGERFISYAIAEFRSQGGLGVPGQLKTTMIFTKDHEHLVTKARLSALPHLAVGFQCSVCPREGCAARRSGYLLKRLLPDKE